MKKFALLLLCLLAACNSPIDVHDTCDAALDGVSDRDGQRHQRCYQDVYRAAWQGGHAAAQPYRDLPRQ